jgi:imidazoleglycerol-phosphate dehydratase
VSRSARVERTTAETVIAVTLDLDGRGRATIDTGIGFYDHLLASFAHHGLFDLEMATKGDLDTDDHHTVEDTALVLGEAFSQALGDRAGITRFGDAAVPMDEALARVAVDVSGRAYSQLKIAFGGERIGGLSTQNVSHALEAFARRAQVTLHVRARGGNDHHVAEATFKAVARALAAAVAPDPRRAGIPSTKGTL